MANVANYLRTIIIQTVDYFYAPFQKYVPLETFRYAATGGFNTILIDLYIVSISPHIAAFLIVFPITFFTGFLLARYITFTSSEIRGRIQLIRYMISVSGSIFLNYVFLKFLVEFGGLWPTLSKIITTVIVVIYSYFVQKFYTFKTARLVAL